LRLFGDVLADAEFIRQSTRRADFRHYVRTYKTAILNSVGTPRGNERLDAGQQLLLVVVTGYEPSHSTDYQW